jgi:hypothetical protein
LHAVGEAADASNANLASALGKQNTRVSLDLFAIDVSVVRAVYHGIDTVGVATAGGLWL